MTRARAVSVLTALVLLLSAASLVLALTRPDRAAVEQRPGVDAGTYEPAAFEGPGGAALAAAVAGLRPALAYDVHDLAASLAAATEPMTAAYAKEFTTIFDRRARPVARKRRAVTEAVVNGAGLVRVEAGKRALCLVLVDQLLVEGTGLAAGAPPTLLTHQRVLVSLVVRSGSWKIDGIRPV